MSTVPVKAINPSGYSRPQQLTNLNGTLYIMADDGVHGDELWKSDGTEEGTVMVMDIRPGPDSSTPVELTNVDGILFFRADDGVNGIELWALHTTQVAIPTVSAWGTTVMALLLLTVGSIVVLRRRVGKA